ncbi:unnamed protein product [Cuscuta campestris]|uniref:Retrotransposon gag domain-containing protein n=1 Tax=Cuscuta campestris TaxID=132261 RepID=A0A484MAG5_9ASTE|nr:unnamed protein product [Cuscuta campestris]
MDPMYSQALQSFGQFMSMLQQPGGFSPFIPGLYAQTLPRVLLSLTKDEDREVPQAQKKLKGKAIQPEGSGRLAFQRLGHEGRNQNRPAKERLGVETIPVSAFDRLGREGGRPGRTRRIEPPPWDEPQHSRAPLEEEEAESHPRHPVHTHIEQPRDCVGRVEAQLEKLQRRVDQDGKKKVLLNGSSFTDRVHETPFPKKAKFEVPKFTGKEDPEIHIKTLHQSGRMMGLIGNERCLLSFQTLRGRAAEWFHNLPSSEIDSFDELVEVFQEKIKENCTKRKTFTYLSTVGQREHEDLTKFLTRWKEEVDKVEEMEDKTAMSLLVSGLRSGELYKEFWDKVIQKQMRFVVVNIKCVYNAILGRPGINKVRGIISMAHLCMKFYTPGGIGQVRGDQKKAQSCYLEAVKKMTKAFERVTLVSQEEDRSKLEPGGETEQIVLRDAFPEKMVRIGRDLPEGLREEIISFLREYADIFAWSVADMPGIDPSVICHWLAVMEADDEWRYDLMEYLMTFQKPDDEERDMKSFGRDHDPSAVPRVAGCAVTAQDCPCRWNLPGLHQCCRTAVSHHRWNHRCRRIEPCHCPPRPRQSPDLPVVVRGGEGPTRFGEKLGAAFDIGGRTFDHEGHPVTHEELGERAVVQTRWHPHHPTSPLGYEGFGNRRP